MENSSVIVVTRLKAPQRPFICKSVPPNVETILVYGGVGSDGRCRILGTNRARKPILVFVDDDVEFDKTFLQRQVDRVEAHPNIIITLGWRQWEAPRVLIVHREIVNKVKFDPNLHALASLDFILRAHLEGFKIETPTSPYDGRPREFYDFPEAWFWYQFNQVAFMLKHRHIPRNAFNPHEEKIIIKPFLFFFNPRTVQGIPTLYKSRRLLCRWIGALYYGTKKLCRL